MAHGWKRAKAAFTHQTPRAVSGAVAAAALLTITAWTPAIAADDLGGHVNTCTRTSGCRAEHNPGMHQGFHGWDPTHTCSDG